MKPGLEWVMELEEQQSEERRDRRNWLILLLLALLLSCSCVFLSTNLALFFLGRPRTVGANLLALSEADYGPDNYKTRLPAPNPSVIAIALTDEAALQVTPIDDEPGSAGTPIALVTATPLPSATATNVSPTATAVPATSTPTPSITVIPSSTASATSTTPPTSTPTSTFTPSTTPTQVTFFTPSPTATPTLPPVFTNTPIPNEPDPSRTPTPRPATATPTFTPAPPTQTPTPRPPTVTPTSTPVLPTQTPTPVAATQTPTSVPPTFTPTFTPIPPTLTPTSVPPTFTPTFTPIPPTLTPTPTPTFTPTPSREALLVVANPGAMTGTDTAVQNRLIALSFIVILADDDTVVVGDALNSELVFISDSVNEGTLGATLCDVRAPVIVAKASLYDEMNLTAVGDNGYEANQTGIDIVDPTHPMAAGLSGTVPLLTGGNNMGWGVAQPSAEQVGTIAGDPSRVTLFAYPASANITCSGLPARRVGFPLAAGAALTLDGWRLFDAAVSWIVP